MKLERYNGQSSAVYVRAVIHGRTMLVGWNGILVSVRRRARILGMHERGGWRFMMDGWVPQQSGHRFDCGDRDHRQHRDANVPA